MSSRRRKKYTPAQLKGMRIVGSILKDARMAQGDDGSYRRFVKFLKDRTGYDLPWSSIQRYENAGRITDSRFTIFNTIHDDYLQAVAPFTPYSVEALSKVYAGQGYSFSGLEHVEILRKLIEQREKQLGAKAWREQCVRFGLSDEALEAAKRGHLRPDALNALIGLLGMPPGEIKDAALAQLNHDEGDPDDDAPAPGSEPSGHHNDS